MNNKTVISPLLQKFVDNKIIKDWIAEKLSVLNSQLQLQAVKELPDVLNAAVDGLVYRLQHPEGKVLYQAPAYAIGRKDRSERGREVLAVRQNGDYGRWVLVRRGCHL